MRGEWYRGSHGWSWGAMGCLVLVVSVVAVWLWKTKPTTAPTDPNPATEQPHAQNTAAAASSLPATADRLAAAQAAVRRVHTQKQPAPPADPAPTSEAAWDGTYGTAPGVAASNRPDVASVAAAARTGQIERVTALVRSTSFTVDQWTDAEKRQQYLNTVEPGRVWQTADPGPQVPQTSFHGANALEVEQGTVIDLVFHSAPDAPLSLLSHGLGAFANGLTAITVVTDAQGQATVPWTAIPGTLGDVTVVAASPLAVGQAQVAIEVTLPVAQALAVAPDERSQQDTAQATSTIRVQ